ncbi:MAG: DUF721 domain-containing protein [Candidatus Eremiobacteraeota bacterium]|nr:DUF721 domain-containing protein [Candidatus Eremiobacteraeota bacterium]
MSGPRRLHDLIAGWRPGRVRGGRSDDVATAALSAAWEQAVGADVARRSRPLRFRNGTLTVLTASSTWSDELTLHAPAILVSLRRAVPDLSLLRLRFVVASGRTQLLFESGYVPSRDARRDASPAANAAPVAEEPVDVRELVERLATTQRALDVQRDAAGWTRCAACEKRIAPAASASALCAPCTDARRRRRQAAVERFLMQAPWSSFGEIKNALPDTTWELYERTRSSLLARWQAEMDAAGRRLRRGSLSPQDRVVAWSYIMLASGLAQKDLGRAAVDNVLGRQWAAALFGDLAPQRREAGRSLRENLQ